MKKNVVILFVSWILFGVYLTYIGEYVISRPMNGSIQLICIVVGLTLAVTLIRMTAETISKFLKQKKND